MRSHTQQQIIGFDLIGLTLLVPHTEKERDVLLDQLTEGRTDLANQLSQDKIPDYRDNSLKKLVSQPPPTLVIP